jgi:hypothetical protein
MPSRDVLNFITSGRMSSLRELSIAIDYKDWVSPAGDLFDPFKLFDLLTYTSITSFNDSRKYPIFVHLTSHLLQTMSPLLSTPAS